MNSAGKSRFANSAMIRLGLCFASFALTCSTSTVNSCSTMSMPAAGNSEPVFLWRDTNLFWPFLRGVVGRVLSVRQFMIDKDAGFRTTFSAIVIESLPSLLPLSTVSKAQPFPYSVTEAKPNARRLQIRPYEILDLTETS